MTTYADRVARLRAAVPSQRPVSEPVSADAWGQMTPAMQRDHINDLDESGVFTLARAVAASAGRPTWEIIMQWSAAGLIGSR